MVVEETVPLWKQRANALKEELDSCIPEEWKLKTSPDSLPLNTINIVSDSGILSKEELGIISIDATDLASSIAKKKYTAVEVATAYAKSAAIAHQATNCLSRFFPKEALERAKWLDEQLQKNGKPVGPLHGVPISVKDHIGLKGQLACIGFTATIRETIADSLLVAKLREAGAVFMVKTCVPQAGMQLETDSFRGPTLNPYNRKHTPGGSSGGEAALIASKGGVLGIGTDIGGSIRNPCAHVGIYGFKPTVGRVPRTGGDGISAFYGQDTILATTGPMGRSIRDLELWITSSIMNEPWKDHPSVLKMPWRKDEVVFKNGNLPKIGIMWDDGVVRPQPPMRRALKYTKEKLIKAGFEVIDVLPYKSAEAWDITSSLYFSDGGETNRSNAAKTGEPIWPLTEWIMTQSTKPRTAAEVMELNLKRDIFRAEYHAYFRTLDIDVMILPPAPDPAPRLGTSKYWNYTSLFNLVDYPGGTLPTGLHVESTDIPDEAYEFTGKSDKEVWENYNDVNDFVGLPLGIQVVGKKYEDEKVLEAMKLIEEAIRA
ncbi:uncharacterized protein L201_003833 [Kwoniella dendrophila CBS 6074]|uniref:amidase n=1 Tax=Kwoniella dendrophila CBS 6074 TaxID=1295534 RepID=A0AAX4JWL8_9TREE